MRLDVAAPLLGGVVGEIDVAVARDRLQVRCARTGGRSQPRGDAGQRVRQPGDHRGRIGGAEEAAPAVDRGVPEVVDRARVVPVVLVAVVERRIRPQRPVLRARADVGEVAGGHRAGLVVGPVLQAFPRRRARSRRSSCAASARGRPPGRCRPPARRRRRCWRASWPPDAGRSRSSTGPRRPAS